MREIKFRAWDKKEKAMRKIARLDLSDGSAYTHLFNRIQLDFWNDVVLEQFTGLHDKNGVEVYEGDLIKYHFGEEIACIKYGSYQSCFDSKKTEHIGFYVDWKSSMRKDLGYWINMIDVEVIGNIHESEDK